MLRIASRVTKLEAVIAARPPRGWWDDIPDDEAREGSWYGLVDAVESWRDMYGFEPLATWRRRRAGLEPLANGQDEALERLTLAEIAAWAEQPGSVWAVPPLGDVTELSGDKWHSIRCSHSQPIWALGFLAMMMLFTDTEAEAFMAGNSAWAAEHAQKTGRA